jgi:cyclic pyranopterin monophosphate synthase
MLGRSVTSSRSLSHFDDEGNAKMVDVGAKPISTRLAIAKSRIAMQLATADAIRDSSIGKGDVLSVARIAGIQAAKQTSNLIPLCHLLPLDKVQLDAEWITPTELEWTAEVRTSAKTGVEMEALVAASIASLTVYDMSKAIDKSMEIVHVGLWFKDGGNSGKFERRKETS